MVRFRQYLSFHLDFQLQKLLLALKMGIFGQRCKVISTKDRWYGVSTLINVRDDPFVSVCMLGLPMVALVVVEIWGEVSPLGEIWWRSQWGEWYGEAVSGSMVM
jgi:hypothetical protein